MVLIFDNNWIQEMEEQKDTKKIVSTKNQFSKHRASIEEKITGKHLNHAVSMIYQT